MLATVRKFARLLPPLSYPLTRDVMLPYCSLLVLILGLVLIPLLTLYAVVATGYEYITITTSNFNATRPMWYDVLNYGDWILPSISCQPSILKPGDVLFANITNGLFSSYQLDSFYDPRSDQYDGMSYSNNALNNANVGYLMGWETISPTLPPIQNNPVGEIASNTSAGQFLTFTFGTQTLNPINEQLILSTQNDLSLAGPLPISLVIPLWGVALLSILNVAFPSDGRSFLFPSLQAHGLSYLAVGYFSDPLQLYYSMTGTPNNFTNTPANGNWNLTIVYSFANSSDLIFNNIVFSSTGEIDINQTSVEALNSLNTLLSESFAHLRSETNLDFDPWRLLNWVFVSFYWVFLGSFGQVEPTTYPLAAILTTSPIPDFSRPSFWTSSNNIFVNNTLFEIYSPYVLDIFALETNQTIQFMPLDQSNRLEPQEITFIRGYQCQQRQLKHGFIFSVLPSVLAPLTSAWALLMFVVIKIDTSRRNRYHQASIADDFPLSDIRASEERNAGPKDRQALLAAVDLPLPSDSIDRPTERTGSNE